MSNAVTPEVAQQIASIVMCAMNNDYSMHRFALAPAKELWMFNGQSAEDLQQAHDKGCEKCRLLKQLTAVAPNPEVQ